MPLSSRPRDGRNDDACAERIGQLERIGHRIGLPIEDVLARTKLR
jgi:hypothetical protein